MREDFKRLLDRCTPARRRINQIVNSVLTDDDKAFLKRWNKERLLEKMQGIAPDAGITMEDIEANFWAYRVMGSLRTYDEKFKESYTRIVGRKIDALLPKYGEFLSDNGIRNNAVPEGGIVVPFDFNSIKYGLRQMDEAAVLGLYMFQNMLGVFDTDEKVREAVDSLRKCFTKDEDPGYFEAFILSTFHEQATLAGYRAQEMLRCEAELRQSLEAEGGFSFQDYGQFRCAFDEIDLHQSAAAFMAQEYTDVFLGEDAGDAKKVQELHDIADFITRHSFVHRSRMMFSPVFEADGAYMQALYRMREERARADSLS
jgi:hypothetical protein